MKRWFVLAMAIVIVSLWGCTNPTPTATPQPTPTPAIKDARTVFETWLAAARANDSEQARYTMTIDLTMKDAPQPLSLVTRGELYRKGNRTFRDMEVSRGQVTQRVRQYLFEDEVYVATLAEGVWKLQKGTPPIYFSHAETLAQLQSMYWKGALVIEPGVERKVVGSEEGDQIRLSVDTTKLSPMDRKFLLFTGGLSNVPSAEAADAAANALKSFEARLCLLPNGAFLERETMVVLDADALPSGSIVTSHVLTTASEYKVGVPISDALFELPSSQSQTPPPTKTPSPTPTRTPTPASTTPAPPPAPTPTAPVTPTPSATPSPAPTPADSGWARAALTTSWTPWPRLQWP